MNKNDFIKYLENLNNNISTEKLQLLQKYCDFLLDYNKTTNLTAIKDEDNVYLKHITESVEKIAKNHNAIITIPTPDIGGWPANPHCRLLDEIKRVYREMYNAEIQKSDSANSLFVFISKYLTSTSVFLT